MYNLTYGDRIRHDTARYVIDILGKNTYLAFMGKTAIILGATGLTGSILTQKLIEDVSFEKIKLITRRPANFTNPKIEEIQCDVLQLESIAHQFTGNVVFCCIGTTAAKTPDKKLYHQIDYGIPVQAAQLAKEHRCNTFIVISSLGAHPESRIFYNRTKGRMEKDVLAINIPNTYILQPSLIGGHRDEKRSGEYLMKVLMKIINPLLFGKLKKYRTIQPKAIATAMIHLAKNTHTFDTITIESDQIKKIATYES